MPSNDCGRDYLDGFEAGVHAALAQVRRLNFSEVADRARARVVLPLDAVKKNPAIDQLEEVVSEALGHLERGNPQAALEVLAHA